MLGFNKFVLALASVTFFVITAAFGSSDGQAGDGGNSGILGSNGAIGNISDWYAQTPLCSSAMLIVASQDRTKLSQFLAGECSITQIPPMARNSLFELLIIRQEPELLQLVLENNKARSEIDLYALLRRTDRLERIPDQLNPFEVTVFARVMPGPGESFPTKPLSELYVDAQQIQMLTLLLNHSTDIKKLRSSIQNVLGYLKDSNMRDFPTMVQAIQLIETRIEDLS